ncbi:MAG: hypothetical protein AAF512_16625, partial [Pseudomonadota bacterium]
MDDALSGIRLMVTKCNGQHCIFSCAEIISKGTDGLVLVVSLLGGVHCRLGRGVAIDGPAFA